MKTQFAIEDEMHAELVSRHASRADALAELRRLALVPCFGCAVVGFAGRQHRLRSAWMTRRARFDSSRDSFGT